MEGECWGKTSELCRVREAQCVRCGSIPDCRQLLPRWGACWTRVEALLDRRACAEPITVVTRAVNPGKETCPYLTSGSLLCRIA